MKTFTNCAEKKAKQILNLLQGYTKGIRMTAILVLLLMGVSNAWAHVTYYLKSGNTTWSTDTYDWGFTHGTTTTTYMDNNSEFKLWRTDWGQDGWFGQGNNTTINLKENDHNGVQLQQWKDGGNVKYVGPSGMVCFHMDQNDGKEDKPWVWITRPTFYLKHNWGGGSWTWKALEDNKDGTYTLTAKYGGTGANYGDDNTSQDGWGYIEDKTPDGTPTTSHNCEFKFNSKDKSLTITRLYTITYNGNDHTGGTVPEAVDKKHGTNITLSSNILTRTGYTFKGWNTKKDGTGTTYAKGATYSTNADVTLYAKWTANTYKVQFNANGGTGSMSNQTFTYDVAQNLTKNTFNRSGYTFAGWNTNTGGTGTKYTNQQSVKNLTSTNNGTVNLYAQWTENKYNVVISTDGNGTTNPTGTKSIGIVGISITATPEIGSAFKQWEVTDGAKVANATSATTTITATSAGTVKAVFEEKPATTIYLEPTGFWNSHNAKFVAHVWNASGADNITMRVAGEGTDKYYTCEVPYGYTDVVFYRVDPSNTSKIWNQTNDLKIPIDKNTLYEIKSTGNNTPGQDGYEAATGTWKAANLVYTITLGYCDFGTYGIKYNGQSYFSKPNENVTIDVPAGAQIEILEGQPFSNAYTGDVIKAEPTKEELTTGRTLTINGDITLDDNFKTKERHVVYLGVLETLDNWQLENNQTYYIWRYDSKGSISMTAADEGSYVFTKDGIKYYRFTIAAGCNSYRFERKDKDSFTGTTHACSEWLDFQIPLTDVNCFTLKDEKDDKNRYKGTWGVLPAQPGDYRLLYVEQVVEKSEKAGDEWKTIITRKKAHPSNIIRKGTASQIVSLHTYYKDRKYDARLGDGSTYKSSNNPEIILQKYIGNDQWQDVECQMVYGPLETLPIMANLPGRKNASPNSNIDDLQHQDGIENIKKDVLNHPDKGNGVWNFVVTQDGDKASVQWNETRRYEGEYYIRTDNAEGGWDQYTLNDNYMTYSQYAKDHSGFSHYFCRWVEKNITPNTKFVIANDHGVAISDTLAKDDYTDEHGTIAHDANIRWSWNMVNNEIARAYIQGTWKAGSQERNRNLVVNYKSSSTAADQKGLLDDSGDWIYQRDFTVNVGSHLNSLTAQYPVTTGPTQTFASNLDMLTGDPAVNDRDYTVRILYDFKINKTLVALVPNANEASIAIDVVIERINQGEATQVQAPIAYTNNQRSGEGSTVYGVMSFDKSHLTGQSLSSQQKLTYWISFPFDVKLSEIFGFGEVGDYWMIKYYDGKDRAAKGLYDDNTFWKFITNRNYTLKANQGYVLALNKKVMDANSPIFTNTTRISLYFPSKEKLLNINTGYTQTTCEIPEYTCTITSPTDRRTKDSNWNFIGVPSFANKNRNTTNENLKYFYDYDYQTDTYSVALNNSRENTFKSMFAYMVQFAGIIDWSTLASNGSQGLAAKKTDNVEKHVLRIELQQNNTKVDQTYIQLEDEEVTAMFDMNYDLTKLFNSKTNIYSLIPSDTDPIQVAANVMPIEETIIPLGIKLDAAGKYTFAMPDGTDGIVVELIDYENNTRTNMLLDEYTVNLGKGTFENRFALHVKPNKTTTSLEDVNTNTTGVKKYLIDGVLYMQKDGVLYDAQGKLVR